MADQSVVFTECLQAKCSLLPINISPARGVQKKARNSSRSKEFVFLVPLFRPYGTNSDSSNNYSNNRSYGFSLFTTAPPAAKSDSCHEAFNGNAYNYRLDVAVLLFFPK